jgi:hypothetical protein
MQTSLKAGQFLEDNKTGEVTPLESALAMAAENHIKNSIIYSEITAFKAPPSLKGRRRWPAGRSFPGKFV